MALPLLSVLGRLGVASQARGFLSVRTEVRAASAIRALEKFDAGLKDREPIHRKIGIQLYGWVIRNFASGGGEQRPPWAPLAQATAREKSRLGYSALPLQRTGNLRQSFAPFADREVAGVGARASYGVDYAQVHERGTARVPARPMLPPREVALKIAVDLYGLEIGRLKTAAGL